MKDAEIIFGAVIDDNMGEEVRVTVIATGFDSHDVKLVNDMAQVNQMQNFLNQQAAQFGSMNMNQFQMPSMPQMPPMPQFPQMPVMPTMPQMPQMPPMELPPIAAVQSQVMSFTQPQQPEVPPMMPVTETVVVPPVAPVTPQMAQQAAQNMMTQHQPPPQMSMQHQPTPQEMATPIQPQVETPGVSPRDLLLAKARAFKESQDLKVSSSQSRAIVSERGS